MSASIDRDDVIDLAMRDPEAALVKARRIADPWYRSQALAWVAWLSADDTAFERVIVEALQAAQGAADLYHHVGLSAWPIRALIERRKEAQAVVVLENALKAAPQIDHPVRRADALFLVFQAAYPLGLEAISPIVDALVEACSGAASWKGPYILQDVARMLASNDLTAADRVVEAMSEGRDRRQAARRVREGQFMLPRAFFWRDRQGPSLIEQSLSAQWRRNG